jgi:hypothetical protein
MKKHFMMRLKRCMKFWKAKGPKYAREMKAWYMSKSAVAQRKYEFGTMWKTEMGKEVREDAEDVVEDMMTFRGGEGPMKNGGW